jgi:hemolysin activation/secretion protein
VASGFPQVLPLNAKLFEDLMKRPPQPLASTCLLMLAMCTSIPAHSAPPDAGQASRELQPRPELTAPTDRPGVRTTEEADPRSATQSGARVFVRSLRFRGNQAIASSELEALLAYLAGGERSFGDLQRGVSRVTALYRQRGFPVARALLPPQNVLNDEIEIQVLEGELGQTMLSNRSRVSDASAMPFLNSLRSGDAIETPNVERALQLLGDLPGVGAARATLQPGASVGTADLLLELEPAQAYLVQLEADNYGNRYVGEYRVGATIAWNSPLEQGDLLTLRALTSGENLNYLRAAYQLPLGGNGLQGGAAYADTRYRLGEEFASLQQRGAAYSKSLFMSYPLVRSRTANASASLTWEDKALIDESAVPGSGVEKRLELLTLEGSGNRLDGLGGGGQWAFHVAFASGTRAMDAASRAQDAAVGSAHTHGGFNKITYALQRAQRLGDDYSLVATLSGQKLART